VPLSAALLAMGLGYQVASFEATIWPAIWAGAAVAGASGTLVHTRYIA